MANKKDHLDAILSKLAQTLREDEDHRVLKEMKEQYEQNCKLMGEKMRQFIGAFD